MNKTYIDCLATFGVGGAHPGGLQLTKKILSNETIDQTKSVLDVGCGTGQSSAYISKKYKCDVTSLDHNKIMVAKAKQRFSSLGLSIEAKVGNTENLPFNNRSFDFILSESVIAFTSISLTISELRRVLKPTGVLLAIEMVLEKPIPEEEVKLLKNFYGFSQLLSKKEWTSIFRKSGFNHVSVEEIKLQSNQNDLVNAADYILSEDIDDKFFNILEEHNRLTNLYKNVLGYRVFRCS